MPNNTQTKPPVKVTAKPPLRPLQAAAVSKLLPPAAPRPNLAAGLAAAQRSLPVPKGLTKGNTNDLGQKYFFGCIYGETNTRKTSTAALFGTPEEVRVIMTRPKEQLTPLENMGYQYATVTNGASLIHGITYPENVWPEWKRENIPDRILVIDDITEGEQILLNDQSETGYGKEYRGARDDLKTALRAAAKQRLHIVLVAIAKPRENEVTNEERIGPDLSPSILRYLLTDVNYVFYIDTKLWQFLTDRKYVQHVGEDDKGKRKVFKQEIFAKNKLPLELAKMKPPLLKEYEPMDLRAIWEKVVAAKEVK